jgi:hypothetical protein
MFYFKEIISYRGIIGKHTATVVSLSKKEDNIFFCDTEIPNSFAALRNSDLVPSNFSYLTNINNENGYDFIYLGDIPKAKNLLLNKQVYILTNEWRQDDSTIGFTTYSKYVPVTITITQIGASDNINFPVKIIFKDSKNEEYYIITSLSGVNQGHLVELWGCWSKFSKVFSFKNPKLKYPKISVATWGLIQKGKVKVGMSKETCRLSWGEPEDINKASGTYGTHEQWVYSSGSYLYFENGKLTSIQN